MSRKGMNGRKQLYIDAYIGLSHNPYQLNEWLLNSEETTEPFKFKVRGMTITAVARLQETVRVTLTETRLAINSMIQSAKES